MWGGIRKVIRKDPIKDLIVGVPPPLTGGIFLYGKPGCLDEETEIYVYENNKIIKKMLKDLPNEFHVISYNVKLKRLEITFATKLPPEDKELFEIEFTNGTKILASKEHIFYRDRKTEVKVKSLKSGDLLSYKDIKVLQNKYQLYRRIKKLAIKGKSPIEIKTIIKELKYRKYCYDIALNFDDKELLELLLYNAKIHTGKGIKKYKLTKQDYSYLKGHNNHWSKKEIIAKCLATKKEHNYRPTQETKNKISKSLIGQMVGDKNPAKRQDVRDKIKLAMARPETKAKLSKAFSGKNNPMYGKVAYPKLKFDKKLNHSIRSNWERLVFLKLLEHNIEYIYEPEAFKVGNHTYTPDAKIIATNIYLEIKGPVFDWQVEKMKMFKISNPDKKLIVICGKSSLEKFSFCDYVIQYEKFLELEDINAIFKN